MAIITMNDLIIKKEAPADYDSVYEINRLAFNREDEAKLVDQLREKGDSVISLVAVKGTQLVGHILLSRIFIQAGDQKIPSISLAPVAVLPEFQNQGIGSQLIKEGIDIARKKGESTIFVLGHKEYYPKFGFSDELAKNIENPFENKSHFMALELKPRALNNIKGDVKYAQAFGLGPEWTK